jgi:hypothetical protein
MTSNHPVPDRPLYADGPDPEGYRAAAGTSPGRPESTTAEPYRVVQLGRRTPSTARTVLFTLENYPEPGVRYQGSIPDPVPASYYAQLLLDAVEIGQQMAEVRMIHRVMGEENLKALAAAPDLGPNDMKLIMAQVFERAMGPYRDGQKNAERA